MIFETLLVLNVQCKATPGSNDGLTSEYRLRIGGHDKRQMIFKGWVVIEKFVYKDHAEGSFVVMKRDEVSKMAVFYAQETYLHYYRAIQSPGGSFGKR